MKVHLVALKPMRYGTRRLRAGDDFVATTTDARVLRAIRSAGDFDVKDAVSAPRLERPLVATAAPQAPAAPKAAEPDLLADLRAEYEGVTGEAPDRRWGEARLRTEIRDHRDRRIAGEDPKDETGDLL